MIYVDFVVFEKTYLLAVYAKNVQENLTRAECNELKALVNILEKQLEGRR